MSSPSVETGYQVDRSDRNFSSSSSSSSSSDQEFQRLRISAQEENQKTYQQRLQDIFEDHQPSNRLSNQFIHQKSTNPSGSLNHQPIGDGPILRIEQRTNRIGFTTEHGKSGHQDSDHLERADELLEDEDEFIYDGEDVQLFDDEDQDDLQKDYAVRLDEILEFNRLHQSRSTSSPSQSTVDRSTAHPSQPQTVQHDPLLRSPLELLNGSASSEPSGPAKPSIATNPTSEGSHLINQTEPDHQSQPLPPVVIPPDDSSSISSPATSLSQRIPFNRRSGSLTPSQSITGSNTSSNLWFTSKMRPHSANFSRLRSLRPSSTANNSPSSLQPPNKRCVSSATFGSDHSYEDRFSNLRSQSEQPQSPSPSILDRYPSPQSNGHLTPSVILESDPQATSSSGIFRWASLRRISQRIYSIPKRLHPTTIISSTNSTSNTILGLPTVIAASGVIVIGTAKGWVMVFDYASNLKCVLGSDAVVRDAGAVSALSISHDHTFVAVGHIMGHIYLYDLAKPSQPNRTVRPTSWKLVQEGRAEGHLLGNKIIHVDFIGLRHTAIVSADETGMAFYHALGQVLGLASTDVIRILGKYPDSGMICAPETPLINSNVMVGPPNGAASHGRHFSDVSVHSLSIGGPKPRKPTNIFGALPLPLGPTPHSTDHHGLVALLTSSKLIIVALKPTPRTCWRCFRNVSDSNQAGLIGSLSWFPSATVKDPLGSKSNHRLKQDDSDLKSSTSRKRGNQLEQTSHGIGMDPLLAFSWSKTIRFVTIITDHTTGSPPSSYTGDHLTKESFLKGFNRRLDGSFSNLRFVEGKSWCCHSNVLAIQWLSWRVLCVLTSTHFEVIDTQIWQRTGFEPIDLRRVVRLDVFRDGGLNKSHPTPNHHTSPPTLLNSSTLEHHQTIGGSVIGSFKAYKGKVFLLTTDDLRLGMVISWADQILELVETGSLTEAIELTTSYWIGRPDLETIGLPSQDLVRKSIVKPKLIEIMHASLEYLFSERRMEDDTHFDLEGRGVDRTDLFEGLVRSCTQACIVIDHLDFIFDEMFEQYQEHGIQNIFFLQIEPFILRSELSTLPTSITQGIISLHEERQEFDLIEQVIHHVDPASLDINQVLAICLRESLNDALVYVYTEAMNDFVGPIVEFLNLIKTIHTSRQRVQQYCEDSSMIHEESVIENMQMTEDGIERLVPIAYKIFPYLSAVLSGLSYPNKIKYDYARASKARFEVYQFIFSGKSMHWPQPDGKLIMTTEEGQQEPTYPYLRALLMLDTEAMLDTLDVAFEDSWLHEFSDRDSEKQPISRQLIVNLLLEVISGHPEFSPADRTFVYIFIARNLPKYPQFLSLPTSTLHSTLISLSTDDDRSTTEDRQLAVEFLLSVYTPPDIENGAGELLELFKEAGFWRILTSTYTQKEMWVEAVGSYLRDPDLGFQVFHELSQTFQKVRAQEYDEAKVMDVLLNSINQLVDLSAPQTAALIDSFRPQAHLDVVDCLSEKLQQLVYLQTLLEPFEADQNSDVMPQQDLAIKSKSSNASVDPLLRLRYISLLSMFNPNHVLEYLKSTPSLADQTPEIVRVCRENRVFDSLIWQLDQTRMTRAAFEELDIILKSTTSVITTSLSSNDDFPDPQSKMSDESVESCVNRLTRCTLVAAEICVERTTTQQDGLTGEDCWFYLLTSTIQCIQAFSSWLPSRSSFSSSTSSTGHRFLPAKVVSHWSNEGLPSDAEKQVEIRALEKLKELLPTIVSLLISRTKFSSQFSFSNLVRRLIESSSTNLSTSDASKPSSQEFRSIILMIMDTYRFEGNVLEVTGRLIDEDLFEHVDKLAQAKEKGIRPNDLKCFKCSKPIIFPNHPPRSSIGSDSDGNKFEEGGDGQSPCRMKLIKKLGLPVKSVTPLRKQSIKGKEVEQSFHTSSTSFSPSALNHHCSNPQYLNHYPQCDYSHDFHLADSFLNRNPVSPHQHLMNHPSSSFLLGPPPRALTINPHPIPSSPTPSPSRITTKPSSSSSTGQLLSSATSTTKGGLSSQISNRHDQIDRRTPLTVIPMQSENEDQIISKASASNSPESIHRSPNGQDPISSSSLVRITEYVNQSDPHAANVLLQPGRKNGSDDNHHPPDRLEPFNQQRNQVEEVLNEEMVNEEVKVDDDRSDGKRRKGKRKIFRNHRGSDGGIVLIGDGRLFHSSCWNDDHHGQQTDRLTID